MYLNHGCISERNVRQLALDETKERTGTERGAASKTVLVLNHQKTTKKSRIPGISNAQNS